MPMADVNGTRIHYVTDGSQSAPPLILSNSIGADISMWDKQVEAFSKDFYLIRYDTRGHGRSGVPAGEYAISDLADDVCALADHLGFERFNFCGLSLGGMTGQRLGSNSPERLIKLVLCCNSAKSGTPEMWQQRIDTAREKGMEAMADAHMERWFTPAFRDSAKELVQKTRGVVAAAPVEGYIGCAAAIREMDQRESIRAISVPTLVIGGAEDIAAPPADAQLLHDNIPGSRLELIEDAAHLANIEQPEKFNAVVLDFLKD